MQKKRKNPMDKKSGSVYSPHLFGHRDRMKKTVRTVRFLQKSERGRGKRESEAGAPRGRTPWSIQIRTENGIE
jgi:hypothetical protein